MNQELGVGDSIADKSSDSSAVTANDVSFVEHLLKNGMDVNVKNPQGFTPLMLAAFNGNTEQILVLLEHGADIDMRDDTGMSAFLIAALLGDVKNMEVLVNNGADVKQKTKEGKNALILSSYAGHFDAVKYLLDIKLIDVNGVDNFDLTALMYAAQKDKVDVLNLLIEHGADVNKQNNRQFTALHFAALYGKDDNIDALIQAGADVNIKMNLGYSAVQLAAHEGYESIVKKLLDNNADLNMEEFLSQKILVNSLKCLQMGVYFLLLRWSGPFAIINHVLALLIYFAMFVFVSIIRFHLNVSNTNHVPISASNFRYILWAPVYDPNSRLPGLAFGDNTTHISSSFFVAVREKNNKFLEYLLDNGNDVNVKNPDGLTPLMIAADSGNTEMVQCLLAHGADVNMTDGNKMSALMFAASRGDVKNMEALVNSGADVKQKTKEGKNALILMSTLRQSKAVKYLLDAKLDVNATDEHGNTALMYASQNDNVDVLNLLIQYGADVNKVGNDQCTALHFAGFTGQTANVGVLIEAGADVNARQVDGLTPVLIAAEHRHEEIVRKLLDNNAELDLEEDVAQIVLAKCMWNNNLVVYAMLLQRATRKALLMHAFILVMYFSDFVCTSAFRLFMRAVSYD
ncbi:putative ankyrin repeat protein RF_0381 [Physella acuta]|uniref:putative ankyrin repeat protein RF_0381 n=1 Tax=Physella acuta TaxID=109671 RepID=UPI0027DE0E30|nr:putative ankyrin repeat protein RF_0381 [Physella acuta]